MSNQYIFQNSVIVDFPCVIPNDTSGIPVTFTSNGAKDSTNLVGRSKYSIAATGQVGTKFEDGATYKLADSAECRAATGWSYGTANWAYNVDGTPKDLTKTILEENGEGLRFYFGSKETVLYSVDQTVADAKIRQAV